MAFEVIFQQEGQTLPSHVTHLCPDMEQAIALTRKQYPNGRIICVMLLQI